MRLQAENNELKTTFEEGLPADSPVAMMYMEHMGYHAEERYLTHRTTFIFTTIIRVNLQANDARHVIAQCAILR